MPMFAKPNKDTSIELITTPSFVTFGLGLLSVTPATLATTPTASTLAIGTLLLGMALTSVMQRRYPEGLLRFLPVAQSPIFPRASLDALRAPSLNAAEEPTVLAATPVRKRPKLPHHTWTRADGFTLSGPRKA